MEINANACLYCAAATNTTVKDVAFGESLTKM